MPRIRSERPAFDLKFPELAAGSASPLAPPEGAATMLADKAEAGPAYAGEKTVIEGETKPE